MCIHLTKVSLFFLFSSPTAIYSAYSGIFGDFSLKMLSHALTKNDLFVYLKIHIQFLSKINFLRLNIWPDVFFCFVLVFVNIQL